MAPPMTRRVAQPIPLTDAEAPVVVRPFADGHGAVVVGRRGLAFIEYETETAYLSEATCAWWYRVDRAAGYHVMTRAVRSPADLAAVTASVDPPRADDGRLP